MKKAISILALSALAASLGYVLVMNADWNPQTDSTLFEKENIHVKFMKNVVSWTNLNTEPFKVIQFYIDAYSEPIKENKVIPAAAVDFPTTLPVEPQIIIIATLEHGSDVWNLTVWQKTPSFKEQIAKASFEYRIIDDIIVFHNLEGQTRVISVNYSEENSKYTVEPYENIFIQGKAGSKVLTLYENNSIVFQQSFTFTNRDSDSLQRLIIFVILPAIFVVALIAKYKM